MATGTMERGRRANNRGAYTVNATTAGDTTDDMAARKRGMTAAAFVRILSGAGVSQIKAAKELGVSVRTVHRWARDKGTISVAMAQLIRAKFQKD